MPWSFLARVHSAPPFSPVTVDHRDPPRPHLPDPFLQLQSVMYLRYWVCCSPAAGSSTGGNLAKGNAQSKTSPLATPPLLTRCPSRLPLLSGPPLTARDDASFDLMKPRRCITSLSDFFLSFGPVQVVSFPGDFSCAVAGLIFLEYTASAQWSAELLVITFGGGLKSYLVR